MFRKGWWPLNKHKIEREIRKSEDHLEAVNAVFDLGLRLGLERVGLCKAVTIISEMCTNLIKYAKEGKIEIIVSSNADFGLIEMTSQDKGPGIPDLELAMKDNFSTKKSFGVGLPSIKRLSDHFEITSDKNGTFIKASKRLETSNA